MNKSNEQLEKLKADLDRQREIVEDTKASRLRPGQVSALLDPQQQPAEPKAAEVDSYDWLKRSRQ
jgi:hypothetical protein